MPRPTLYHTPEEKRAADAAKAKRWRERNPEAYKATKKRHRESHVEEIRAYQKQYAQDNAETLRVKRVQARKADPEKFKARDRASFEKNPEAQWAKLEAWKNDNPDKLTIARRKAASRTKSKHRAKHTAIQNARHARKKLADVAWADLEFIEELYALANLRTALTGIKWVVDHIVPLTSDLVCGLHCEANLQVIPAVANIKKYNRWWPDMPAATADHITFAERPSLYLAMPAGPAPFLRAEYLPRALVGA